MIKSEGNVRSTSTYWKSKKRLLLWDAKMAKRDYLCDGGSIIFGELL